MDAIFESGNKDKLFMIFINLQKSIIDNHSDELLSYKDFLLGSLKGKTSVKGTLVEKILALTDGDCICHGDFHPGNIILKPDNTAVVIDFMNVSRGRRGYDVARTYYLLDEFSKDIAGSPRGVSIADIC